MWTALRFTTTFSCKDNWVKSPKREIIVPGPKDVLFVLLEVEIEQEEALVVDDFSDVVVL